MGSWGIRGCQSDYGPGAAGQHYRCATESGGLCTFNVAEALDVITAGIIEDIRKANCGSSAESFLFQRKLSAECCPWGAPDCGASDRLLSHRELIVTEYVSKNCDSVDHHIKEFVVSLAELKIFLVGLPSVQNSEHGLYRCRNGDNIPLQLPSMQRSTPHHRRRIKGGIRNTNRREKK